MTFLNEICSTWNRDLFFAAFLWIFLEIVSCESSAIDWADFWMEGQKKLTGTWKQWEDSWFNQILEAKVDWSLQTLLFIIWLIICITLLFCYLLTYICRRYTNMFWIRIATKSSPRQQKVILANKKAVFVYIISLFIFSYCCLLCSLFHSYQNILHMKDTYFNIPSPVAALEELSSFLFKERNNSGELRKDASKMGPAHLSKQWLNYKTSQKKYIREGEGRESRIQ